MRLAFAFLALLVPASFVAAQSSPIAPNEPLTIPTPGGPKLRLPSGVEPLPPSLMLDEIRPLRVPPRSAGLPTLNRFPGADGGANDDADAPDDEESAPRLRLQHRR